MTIYKKIERIIERTEWIFNSTTRDVACPKCNQPKGEMCQTPKGRRCMQPHGDRVSAYMKSITREEFDRRHKGKSISAEDI